MSTGCAKRGVESAHMYPWLARVLRAGHGDLLSSVVGERNG